MNEHEWLAEQFEANRNHLRSVAYRMLGSLSEADDAVQEAWLHLNRSGASGVENMGGWLTTVVARVCLDMLRSRKSRREEPFGDFEPELAVNPQDVSDPEHEVLMADSVGLALLVVLETLTPVERLAFVLHDLFAVPFDEIAPIVGRTPTAARQLASRARRRVRGATTVREADHNRQQEVVRAFLKASRSGDFAGLLAVLDPDVVYRADLTIFQAGPAQEIRGAQAVAQQFAGRAQGAQPALINGVPGLVWAPGGQPRVVFNLKIEDGKIFEIELMAKPEVLGQLDLVLLEE